MYKLPMKKHVHEEITRTYKCDYSEFNQLFGIKKHELEWSHLVMFCDKYLKTLHLFMPTMSINMGDKEDSDYEEEVHISQKKIHSIVYARQTVQMPKLFKDKQETRIITI